MRLSTRGRYALRLMLDVALQPEGGSVSLRSVAGRQEISVKYLEQIAAPLVRTGLLRAVRGARGGYQLGLSPEECTAGMILRAVEGSLSPVACVEDGEAVCGRFGECAAAEVYRRIGEAIDGVVDQITLRELMEIHCEKNAAREG